jgi:hypothetical protein
LEVSSFNESTRMNLLMIPSVFEKYCTRPEEKFFLPCGCLRQSRFHRKGSSVNRLHKTRLCEEQECPFGACNGLFHYNFQVTVHMRALVHWTRKHVNTCDVGFVRTCTKTTKRARSSWAASLVPTLFGS